jgi:hypothetical protein
MVGSPFSDLRRAERAGVEIAVDRERLREALAPTVGKAS